VSEDAARWYDAIYEFKDYAAESARLCELIRSRCPAAKTVLDVGCGTGGHARCLVENHRLSVTGIDVDERSLAIARAKVPLASFVHADMVSLRLGRKFDAVVTLFGAIGYLRTIERLCESFRRLREHLSPGGVVVIEPFLTPDEFRAGRIVVQQGRTKDGTVERRCSTQLDGAVARLRFEYRTEERGEARTFSETHELGLFSRAEVEDALAACGLETEFVPEGLFGRGLWLAGAAA
jgi:ubiquinone/menaquinone biosynthesis C-methylase UbiE